MPYNVILDKDAVKYLKRLPENLEDRIFKAMGKLAKNPNAGKPLSGELKGFHSLRVGDYRIIYTIEDIDVVVHAISPRGQAYR